ncbi:probable polygalacturonase At3g15720 [Rhododendron vialii]|uniref:probable polygalacturonase At3g15720 n=1 Tax=Rhododendron vialii TaxID=182163 RepID=UPI00265F1D2C|nr:probable polygalacturonase At3g15720 [Rhododendron vialii]
MSNLFSRWRQKPPFSKDGKLFGRATLDEQRKIEMLLFRSSAADAEFGFHTIALLLLLLCMVMVESSAQGGGFDVVEFGAVGDGETDDSKAFQKAWKEVCGSTSNENSSLLVPKGKTFLLKTALFEGPCKSPSINFQVLGNIIAPIKKDFGNGTRFWLVFSKVDGLIVNGDGDVDGNGPSWWAICGKVLTINSCRNLQVSELRITNAPQNHISMTNCADITISNINITTPGTVPNTDGIDISLSTRVTIQDSVIKTGDDCIALNTGCSYVNITGVHCGPGHGISIGSLGKDGSKGTVEEVHVVNCTFFGTQNAARIKTWQGGSGFAKNILFKDITLVESKNPILINQYYCDGSKNCKNQTSAVKISDISFIGFTGTSASRAAVQLLCSESVGCNRLVLDGISITASANAGGGKDGYISSKCINAHGTSSASNMPSVPCLLPNEDDKPLHS